MSWHARGRGSLRRGPTPAAHAALVGVAASVVVACGGDGSTAADPRASVLSDSDGIEIVVSTAPAAEWAVPAAPALELGALDAAPEFLFDRISDAVRLSDGRVVVSNCYEPFLRWYSPEGAYLFGAGREGEGPGEIQEGHCGTLQLIVLPGDTLGVWSPIPRRLQRFGPAAGYTRVIELDRSVPMRGAPTLVGVAADGRVAMESRDPLDREDLAPGTIRRDTLDYHLFTPEGGYAGGLARGLPGGHTSIEEIRTATRVIRDIGFVPFAVEPLAAVGVDGLYSSRADAAEIRVHGLDGRLRGLIRTGQEPQEVTPALVERYREYRRAALSAGVDPLARQRLEDALDELVYPNVIPVWDDLHVDRDGLVWAREFLLPWADTARWSVFDATGRWAGRVDVPALLRVTDISSAGLVAVVEDDLGVQRVVVYEIVASASQPSAAPQ